MIKSLCFLVSPSPLQESSAFSRRFLAPFYVGFKNKLSLAARVSRVLNPSSPPHHKTSLSVSSDVPLFLFFSRSSLSQSRKKNISSCRLSDYCPTLVGPRPHLRPFHQCTLYDFVPLSSLFWPVLRYYVPLFAIHFSICPCMIAPRLTPPRAWLLSNSQLPV